MKIKHIGRYDRRRKDGSSSGDREESIGNKSLGSHKLTEGRVIVALFCLCIPVFLALVSHYCAKRIVEQPKFFDRNIFKYAERPSADNQLVCVPGEINVTRECGPIGNAGYHRSGDHIAEWCNCYRNHRIVYVGLADFEPPVLGRSIFPRENSFSRSILPDCLIAQSCSFGNHIRSLEADYEQLGIEDYARRGRQPRVFYGEVKRYVSTVFIEHKGSRNHCVEVYPWTLRGSNRVEGDLIGFFGSVQLSMGNSGIYGRCDESQPSSNSHHYLYGVFPVAIGLILSFYLLRNLQLGPQYWRFGWGRSLCLLAVCFWLIAYGASVFLDGENAMTHCAQQSEFALRHVDLAGLRIGGALTTPLSTFWKFLHPGGFFGFAAGLSSSTLSLGSDVLLVTPPPDWSDCSLIGKKLALRYRNLPILVRSVVLSIFGFIAAAFFFFALRIGERSIDTKGFPFKRDMFFATVFVGLGQFLIFLIGFMTAL